MNKTGSGRKILVGCLLFFAIFVGMSYLLPQKTASIDLNELPQNSIAIDGYVVKKGFGHIWIAEEPIRVWERLTIFFYDGYTIVEKHENALTNHLFKGIQVNQKVRVHGHSLRESLPSIIPAYAIEPIGVGE